MVYMLAKECVWSHCKVFVHLRHIHIINEVYKLFAARWSIVPACFLLEWLLQDC